MVGDKDRNGFSLRMVDPASCSRSSGVLPAKRHLDVRDVGDIRAHEPHQADRLTHELARDPNQVGEKAIERFRLRHGTGNLQQAIAKRRSCDYGRYAVENVLENLPLLCAKGIGCGTATQRIPIIRARI